MTGYARIWSDMLGYWDMMGYVWICKDMVGYVRGGGVCMWREGLAHALQRFLCCPPWFLHLLRQLLKLKRASRSIAKTGFSEDSKSMAGAMF